MYEVFEDSCNAISREKQIKAGSRTGKIQLIQRMNPQWGTLFPAYLSPNTLSMDSISAP